MQRPFRDGWGLMPAQPGWWFAVSDFSAAGSPTALGCLAGGDHRPETAILAGDIQKWRAESERTTIINLGVFSGRFIHRHDPSQCILDVAIGRNCPQPKTCQTCMPCSARSCTDLGSTRPFYVADVRSAVILGISCSAF